MINALKIEFHHMIGLIGIIHKQLKMLLAIYNTGSH